jgi:hypothetical protein
MRGTHDNRLTGREQQTRSWAAPLPDFSRLPRANEPIRQRVEWEARESMNVRYQTVIRDMGEKQVTSAMLQAHQNAGAYMMNPTPSREDKRTYRDRPELYPDGRSVLERPPLPPHSVFQNMWYRGIDMENGDVAREMYAGVKEDNRWRDENIAFRAAGRVWAHQWAPVISLEQIAAAEKLRAERDDYRVDYFASAHPGHSS